MNTPDFKRIEHRYGHSYTVDGRKVPGVTTLISKGAPKPALVGWAASKVAEHVYDHWDDLAAQDLGRDSFIGLLKGVPNADRDRAANRGTQVHTLAERILQGSEVEVPDELAGHVDSYIKFLDTWQPTDEHTEVAVLSTRHNYAGTFDLLCTIESLGRCLIDLKTNRSGIFPEVALQLAAYRAAQYALIDGELQTMPVVDHTLALWIRADGYDLYPVDTSSEVFRSFLYVADTAMNFIDASRDRFIGRALPTP